MSEDPFLQGWREARALASTFPKHARAHSARVVKALKPYSAGQYLVETSSYISSTPTVDGSENLLGSFSIKLYLCQSCVGVLTTFVVVSEGKLVFRQVVELEPFPVKSASDLNLYQTGLARMAEITNLVEFMNRQAMLTT